MPSIEPNPPGELYNTSDLDVESTTNCRDEEQHIKLLYLVGKFSELRSTVVLKLPRKCNCPESTEKQKDYIRNEYTALRVLQHPHIIRSFGYYYDATTLEYGLILEWCEGGDMLDFISVQSAPYKKEVLIQIVTYLWQIANAVLYMHSNRYLHRDLKLENCFISNGSTAQAKLADFGFSKPLDEGKDSLLTTSSPGSPHHISPEIYQGIYLENNFTLYSYSFHSDVYAFAGLVYQALYHCSAFSHTLNIMQIRELVLDGVRPPLDHNPTMHPYLGYFKPIISQGWDQIPGARPSMEKFVEALDLKNLNAMYEIKVEEELEEPLSIKRVKL